MKKKGTKLKYKGMGDLSNSFEEGSKKDVAQDICKHASTKIGESIKIGRRKSTYFGHDFSSVTSYTAAAYLAMKDDFFHR